MNAQTTQTPARTDHDPRDARRRKRAIVLVAGLVVVLGGSFAFYWSRFSQFQEVTEDAYVEGNIVQVTTQIAGTVLAIGADNTDRVAAGQDLVKLNPLDGQLALARSEALLARTVRQVRSQYALTEQMRANVDLRQVELEKVQADRDRRSELVRSGAISGEDLVHASQAVRTGVAGLKSAQQQLAANQAYTDGTALATHPDVLSAAAQVKDAYIARARAVVPAPVGGIVARRNVQVGQHVAAGAPLMSIIPIENIWVTANFKEAQLLHIHPGQAVQISSDAYGRKVVYRGTIVGQEAGTGSAFSVMPAQNASGNWIKVVQRLPVRIALNPDDIASHPLQLGLSMRVTVDTHERSGQRFAAARPAAHAYETAVFAHEGKDAAMLVQRIIAANMGSSQPVSVK